MTRGGKRPGAGRPKGSTIPEGQKSKTISITGYPDELKKIKEFVKKLKEQRKEQKMNNKWFVANNNGDLAGHDLTEAKAKELERIMQEQEPDAEWEALEAD